MVRRIQRLFGLSFSGPVMEGRLDLILLAAVAALLSLGSIFVFSASLKATAKPDNIGTLLPNHLFHIAIGVTTFFVVIHCPSDLFKRAWPLLSVLAGLLLLLVLFFGEAQLGAKRWLRFGPITVQPSEIAKFAFALHLAGYLSKRLTILNDPLTGIVPLGLVYAFFAGLLYLQPDLGSIILLGALVGLMLLAGGARLTILGSLVAILLLVFVALVMTSPEKLARVIGWLDPEAMRLGDGYQTFNASLAVRSGGLFGVGIGQGLVHVLGFLPQSESDFLFAVVAEETGLVGVISVVLMYAVIALRGLGIALRCPDEFSRIASLALTLTLTLPAVIHMAVTLGLLPTKGLVLPFMSYGGSAMVTSLASVGLLERFHLEATATPISTDELVLGTSEASA